MNNIISQIDDSVEQIATGNQISESSQSLSVGSSKQAASLEEMTASIDEIASKVQQNVENSRKPMIFAKETKAVSDKGNKQMKELVLAMEKVNKSAEDIKKIVKVIDDIAFQTNLLALNADIEAARVGKYGRGFAVVANSVRNLAAKSGLSVKETTTMIEEVIKNINEGNNLVKITAEQLEKITESSVKLSLIANEVAEASQEQANGIEQISTD
jgi:methyl-accepting chemotaxis protein